LKTPDKKALVQALGGSGDDVVAFLSDVMNFRPKIRLTCFFQGFAYFVNTTIKEAKSEAKQRMTMLFDQYMASNPDAKPEEVIAKHHQLRLDRRVWAFNEAKTILKPFADFYGFQLPQMPQLPQ
jgi:hypothetical protein